MALQKDSAARWHVRAVLGQAWPCPATRCPLSLLAPGLLLGDQLLSVGLWLLRQQSPGPGCREGVGP